MQTLGLFRLRRVIVSRSINGLLALVRRCFVAICHEIHLFAHHQWHSEDRSERGGGFRWGRGSWGVSRGIYDLDSCVGCLRGLAGCCIFLKGSFAIHTNTHTHTNIHS